MASTFGIYPGGTGADERPGLIPALIPGPDDDPGRIAAALDELAGDREFVVRGYHLYSDRSPEAQACPARPERYLTGRRTLDLVLCFRETGDDRAGWLEHIRWQLRRHGDRLAGLQIGEEPNHAGPGGDGIVPGVARAVVEGVLAARAEADRLGLAVPIGVNATPSADGGRAWWAGLGRLGGREFAAAVGYAGLDFFPDVFRPLPADRLESTVEALLTDFRAGGLPAAGLGPEVPIRITETGWCTSGHRSPGRQAEVLATVIRLAARLSEPLHLTHVELFGLRDAVTGDARLGTALGLLTDDYRPKPAFDTVRGLVSQLAGASMAR